MEPEKPAIVADGEVWERDGVSAVDAFCDEFFVKEGCKPAVTLPKSGLAAMTDPNGILSTRLLQSLGRHCSLAACKFHA